MTIALVEESYGDVMTTISFDHDGTAYRIHPRPITYRIISFDFHYDYYKCVMLGTDGSYLSFHVTDADLHYNLGMVAETRAQVLEMVA